MLCYFWQTWRGARDDLELSGGQLGQNLSRTPAAHRHSTPDVVKSTMPHRKEVKYNEETIDTILGTPQKILIPERYVPEVLNSFAKRAVM